MVLFAIRTGLRLGEQMNLELRWHDLRHTCASSLVSGWLGRRWSLEETKEFMGHISRSSTERYAQCPRTHSARRRPRPMRAVGAEVTARLQLR